MKKIVYGLLMVCIVVLMTACGGKKKSDDIIAQRVVKAKPQAPVRMQEYDDDRDISWIGRQYHIAIHRQPADSLPMVKDETGQKFVDNVITLVVSRQDGSVFFSRTLTKATFLPYLDADYSKTGILEGFVFDKADGDWLEFAASVSHPQTDEYIPLVVRLSRMGDVVIRRDTSLDTHADTEAVDEEDTE